MNNILMDVMMPEMDGIKENMIGAESTVAVHIRHLREKLEYDSTDPRYLIAVWGRGYKIEKGTPRERKV